MAASVRTVMILDGGGAPNPSATPTILKYVDKTGANRTPPAIINVGGGIFSYSPTDADEAVGTVALIDCGAGIAPRYVVEAIYQSNQSNQFWAWHLEDSLVALWTGAAPTVGVYSSKLGASRSAPAVNEIFTYLFTLTPSADDVAVQTVARIDSPASAFPEFLVAETGAINAPYINTVATPGLNAERISIQALREYLLQHLPAKCDELNLLRAAVVKSTGIGPVVIPADCYLTVARDREAASFDIPLTAGTRTWAQVVTDFNAVSGTGMTASVDGQGYFCITDDTTPTYDSSLRTVTTSCINIRPEAPGSEGVNVLFGWDPGGEFVVTSPLVPPQYRAVCDGLPLDPPDMGQGFWVILGNRSTTQYGGRERFRQAEFETSISVDVLRAETNQLQHRSREAISSCVRAIQEVLGTTAGRLLGRNGADVQMVTTTPAEIAARPIPVADGLPPVFDIATFTVTVRTYQLPATT